MFKKFLALLCLTALGSIDVFADESHARYFGIRLHYYIDNSVVQAYTAAGLNGTREATNLVNATTSQLITTFGWNNPIKLDFETVRYFPNTNHRTYTRSRSISVNSFYDMLESTLPSTAATVSRGRKWINVNIFLTHKEFTDLPGDTYGLVQGFPINRPGYMALALVSTKQADRKCNEIEYRNGCSDTPVNALRTAAQIKLTIAHEMTHILGTLDHPAARNGCDARGFNPATGRMESGISLACEGAGDSKSYYLSTSSINNIRNLLKDRDVVDCYSFSNMQACVDHCQITKTTTCAWVPSGTRLDGYNCQAGTTLDATATANCINLECNNMCD